jgi:hypothetical protein
MQNRYVGDIGDYVKFAILRALSPDRRLGVAWWLYEDEDHNKNGRHTTYLDAPEKWRHLDPALYDGLKKIVGSGKRDVKLFQDANLLPGAKFHDTLVPTLGTPAERKAQRVRWYEQLKRDLAESDLVFLDPDNGLETDGFSAGAKDAGKSVSISELVGLDQTGRTLIVYHHQTRRKGGHFEEIRHWSSKLAENFRSVDAIRSKPYSPRVFFILNATPEIQDNAKRMVHSWGDLLSWHSLS